jgi:anthranilate phosphoribosyltransferase
VVHSRDGMDEISVSAPTHVCEVRDGQVRSFEIRPEDAGLRTHPIEAVAGGDAKVNAQIARAILEGGNGARHDIVVLNAGAALYVSGNAESIRDGVELAKTSLRSGAALAKLGQLVASTNEVAA